MEPHSLIRLGYIGQSEGLQACASNLIAIAHIPRAAQEGDKRGDVQDCHSEVHERVELQHLHVLGNADAKFSGKAVPASFVNRQRGGRVLVMVVLVVALSLSAWSLYEKVSSRLVRHSFHSLGRGGQWWGGWGGGFVASSRTGRLRIPDKIRNAIIADRSLVSETRPSFFVDLLLSFDK